MAFRILILCLILFIIEIYAFQAVKTITKVAWIKTIYLIISISVIVFIGYQFTKFDRSVGQTKMTMITLGLLLLFFIPKFLISIVLLFEDIYRLFLGTSNYFSNYSKDATFFPQRRKFVSQIAFVTTITYTLWSVSI